MKKITFDKAVPTGYRKDYPGYLLTHSAHPGREFVIARGSIPMDDAYQQTKWWFLYDRATGVSLQKLTGSHAETLAKAEDNVRAQLFALSPEQIQHAIDTRVMTYATRVLRGLTTT